MYQLYLKRCLQIAQNANGLVSPNPMVGAILVHDHKIIGEGWHKQFGGPHAEVNAIAAVAPENKHLIASSTLFVSLEPCSHYGKTPPCADLILQHNIKKVVIGCLDPNPQVAGNGVAKLRAAGVEVITDLLETEAKSLIQSFAFGITHKRPYVMLKWAQTQNGFMGLEQEQKWLTDAITQRVTHQWRSEVDAIAIGANTLRTDNPTLSTRFAKGKNPKRIVFATRALPPDSNIFNTDAPTLVVCPDPRVQNLPPHVQIWAASLITEQDWLTFLQRLYQEWQVGILQIEGGSQLLNTFIKHNLWQEARVLTSPQTWTDGILAPTLNIAAASNTELLTDTLSVYKNL